MPDASNTTVAISLAKSFKGRIQVTVQGNVTAANGASSNINAIKNL